MHSTSQSCAMHCGAIIIESAQYNANQGNAMLGAPGWSNLATLCGAVVVVLITVWCNGAGGVCVVL